MSAPTTKILYCRCAFAKVVPDGVKNEVLEGLCASGRDFDTVSDLCEMAARRDERLKTLLDGDTPVRIAACYPRAVKWLFHQGGAPFPDEASVEVLNMREDDAPDILDRLTEPDPPATGS